MLLTNLLILLCVTLIVTTSGSYNASNNYVLSNLEKSFQLEPLFQHRTAYRQALDEAYILAHGVYEEFHDLAQKCSDLTYYKQIVWPFPLSWTTRIKSFFYRDPRLYPVIANIEPLISHQYLFWKFVVNNLNELKREPYPNVGVYKLFVEIVRLIYNDQVLLKYLATFWKKSAEYWRQRSEYYPDSKSLKNLELSQKRYEILQSAVKLTQRMFVMSETDLKNHVDQIGRKWTSLILGDTGKQNSLTSIGFVLRLFGSLVRVFKYNDRFTKQLRDVLEIKAKEISISDGVYGPSRDELFQQFYYEVMDRAETGEFIVEKIYYESLVRQRTFRGYAELYPINFKAQQKKLLELLNKEDEEVDLVSPFAVPKINVDELAKLQALPDLDKHEIDSNSSTPRNSFDTVFIDDNSHELSPKRTKKRNKKTISINVAEAPSSPTRSVSSFESENSYQQSQILNQLEKSKEICQSSMTLHGSKKYRYTGLLSKFQFDPHQKQIKVIPRRSPLVIKIDELQDLCRLGQFIKGSEGIKWDRTLKLFEKLGARIDDKFGGSREQVLFPIDPALLNGSDNETGASVGKPIVVTRIFHRPHGGGELGHLAPAIAKFLKNNVKLRYDLFVLTENDE